MGTQDFQTRCHGFEQYPQNSARIDVPHKKLETYTRQIDEREDILFSCPDDYSYYPYDAGLQFWDVDNDQPDFRLSLARSLGDTRSLCCVEKVSDGQNAFRHPLCRFMFLHSKNSRSRLYATRQMLAWALSYHQVQPWFLEFLFPFGDQEEQHDFRFSSLRHKSFVGHSPNLAIEHLGRSGEDVHLCYNLKAVEPTGTNKHMPWSVRQTVVYHSFDTVNGQSFWVVLKGNDAMSKALRQETKRMKWQGTTGMETKESSFASSLQTHLLVCHWACENWRPYINYLQIKMDQLTNQAVRTEVIAEPLPIPDTYDDNLFPRGHTGSGVQMLRRLTGRGTFHSIQAGTGRRGTGVSMEGSSTFEKAPRVETARVEQNSPPRHPYPEIKMSDLQKAQKIEEDATSALYYLRTNIRIVKALHEQYKRFPDMTSTMREHVSQFHWQIQDVIYELEMHESSLESLVKLFNERKNLLYGILEFQNMQASKVLAHKSQNSATKMEKMTRDMQYLTEKTTKETVSMSVIAGVTMFFLPGTFVSTLMSTDVLQWDQRDDGSYEMLVAPGAVYMFLVLSLPLMLAAFCVWILVSWWSRKERRKRKQQQEVQATPG